MAQDTGPRERQTMDMGKNELFLREMESELHDLCQPLTTLQCRLELGQMCGDEVSLMEAIEGGLMETARVFQGIEKMRGQLLRELDRIGNRAQTDEE